MSKHRRLAILIALGAALVFAQLPPGREEPPDFRLPSGKSQREEILKADHEKSLRDAADLVKAAEDLKVELEKNDRHVLSVSSIEKTEKIEKLAKRIRSRLKRY